MSDSDDLDKESNSIKILKERVLPLFNDLVEDKDCLVRAACAQVLPTLCNLAWQEYAVDYFRPAFDKLLKDPNPFVL